MSACLILVLGALIAQTDKGVDATLRVDAGRVIHRLSPLLYGACIEDVNHEIYGGLYSQMIFGESFQEPPLPIPIPGFRTYGGRWVAHGLELAADAGEGPKLIAHEPVIESGEVSVDIFLVGERAGNAGLILKVGDPQIGADRFTGYEVSIESTGFLAVGRHRQNWEPLQRIPCGAKANRWMNLKVRLEPKGFEVFVDGRSRVIIDDTQLALQPGLIGLRTWQRPARFRNLTVAPKGGPSRSYAFASPKDETSESEVSGMWRIAGSGTAHGRCSIVTSSPFIGHQSQRFEFLSGSGSFGIENQGLNRWGINLQEGKPYEGYLWARAEKPTTVLLKLQNRDGSATLASTTVQLDSNKWSKYAFLMTPMKGLARGRFAIVLEEPGAVDVGHAFLQPGDWGRFKGLPVRRDVAEAMIAQRLTVLRYGGSMINHPEYRWKRMIGPRDLRPPTNGTWYPYSTNGWGIVDFLNFCEAAGFAAIPALHMGESAEDMADFIEYVNGSPTSEWGRKRVADGHPKSYQLKYIELGNEEAVNEAYWQRFRPMAEAIWKKDPQIIIVVGDFAYGKVITNPFSFEGGAAANSLATHQKILQLAKENGREVWFDIHIGTDHPPAPNGLLSERSFIEQLRKLVPGASFKVAIFEFNSGNHALKRALSNALAINEVERLGDVVPVACSANALQPDGQNDNGWDQGLLFLNPEKVWLQPPGYVTQMTSRSTLPLLVQAVLEPTSTKLNINAKKSDNGEALVLQGVNWDDQPRTVEIHLSGFTPKHPDAWVQELTGAWEDRNTTTTPTRIKPNERRWTHSTKQGITRYTYPPRSYTILRFE